MKMDRSTVGWIVNTAKKNHWRVSSWMDLDDLIQDGYLHYCRVVAKYPKVKERRHLMALFQRTFVGHLHDLAKRRTRLPQILSCEMSSMDRPEAQVWDRIINSQEHEHASFMLLAADAPVPVQRVLKVLAEGDKRLSRPYRVTRTHRETLNERLCRLAGLDPALDVVTMLRQHFEPSMT